MKKSVLVSIVCALFLVASPVLAEEGSGGGGHVVQPPPGGGDGGGGGGNAQQSENYSSSFTLPGDPEGEGSGGGGHIVASECHDLVYDLLEEGHIDDLAADVLLEECDLE